MNPLFVVCLLVSSFWIVNCELVNSDFQPQYLCHPRLFSTKGEEYPINAYYQLKFEKQLEPLSYYFANDGLERNENREQIIGELITEVFVKLGLCEKVQKLDRTPDRPIEMGELRNHMRTYRRPFAVAKIARTGSVSSNNKLELLSEMFHALCNDMLTTELLPEDELKRALLVLSNSITSKDQISTFRNKKIGIFYKRAIASLNGVKSIRNQNIYLDDSTIGIISYSVYVPFYDRNRTRTDKEQCTNEPPSKFYPGIRKSASSHRSIVGVLLPDGEEDDTTDISSHLMQTNRTKKTKPADEDDLTNSDENEFHYTPGRFRSTPIDA